MAKRAFQALAFVSIAATAACMTDQGVETASQSGEKLITFPRDFTPNDTNITGGQYGDTVTLAGRKASQFVVDYGNPRGEPEFISKGEEGYAQRIQFHETRNRATMKPDTEYWYRTSIYVAPYRQVSPQVVNLFDIKPVAQFPSGRTHPQSPILSFDLEDQSLVMVDALSGKYNCGEYRNASGGWNSACDRSQNFVNLGPHRDFVGRWVEIVINANWSASGDGKFRIWVDGKNRLTLFGDLRRGAISVEYKFGPYVQYRGPTRRTDFPIIGVSYADVIRGSTCAGIGLTNCDALEASGQTAGYRNYRSAEFGSVWDELSLYRRTGGRRN